MLPGKKDKSHSELPILQPNQEHTKPKVNKSGRGPIRAAVLILVHVFILLHVIHYYLRGQTLSPVEPSESMYTLELGQVNAGAIFFGLAILSTVVWGRFFCGWGCHVIALQDLSSYLLRRIGIRPKPFRSRLLVFVPFVLAFYMFCWPTVKRLWRGEPPPEFTNHIMTENFWQTFPGPFIAILTFVVCGGLVVYLLGNKGFCTYGCPYGAFFSISDQMAIGRIRVTDACQHCGQCTANCTSNVMVHAEVRDYGMVVDPGCMKCMDCVSVCPNDALYFGFSSQTSKTAAEPDKAPRRKKSYDFSITEELFGLLVTAVSVFALRGLYDGPGLLLAVGLGVMTAYLAIQMSRVFRVRDMRIQNFRIKRDGRITKIGWWILAFGCVWFAFNIHSSIVQYFRYQGRGQMNRVSATWPELISGQVAIRATAEDKKNIESALKNLQASDRLGFLDVLDVKLGLAYTSMMNGDMKTAEQYLRQAYQVNPSAVREMMIEFLASQDRSHEAEEFN